MRLRDLRRITTSHAILAIGWLLGLWMAAGFSGRAAQRRRDLDTSQQLVNALQAMAVLKPRVDTAYQAYAAAFQQGQPPGPQALLEQLEACADQSMQLNLKPQALRAQAKDSDSKQIGVEVEVETTQQGVLEFLDRLFALPSLVELERLQVTVSASPERPMRANLLVSKHEL